MMTVYDAFVVQLSKVKADLAVQIATNSSIRSGVVSSVSAARSLITSLEAQYTNAKGVSLSARIAVREDYVAYKKTNVFAATILDSVYARAEESTDKLPAKYANELLLRFRLHEARHKLVILERKQARLDFLQTLFDKTNIQFERLSTVMSGFSSATAGVFNTKLSEEVAASDAIIVDWYKQLKLDNTKKLVKLASDRKVYRKTQTKDTFLWPRPTSAMLTRRELNIDELHRIQMDTATYSGHEYVPQFSYNKYVEAETIKVIPLFTTQKVSNSPSLDWGMFIRQVPPYIYPPEGPSGTELTDENALLKTSVKYVFTFKYNAVLDGFYMTKWEDIGLHKNGTDEYPILPYRRVLGNCLVSFSTAKHSRSNAALAGQKTGIVEADILPPYGVDEVLGGESSNPITSSYNYATYLYQRPDPPTDLVATLVGADQVSVKFKPPAVNVDGRLPIGYRVVVYPGLRVVEGTTPNILVRNLEPGTTYQFRAMTNNDRYYSLASEPSNLITIGGTLDKEILAIKELFTRLAEFSAYRSKEMSK